MEAGLKERVSYAALVVTFLGIWRNYVILHPNLNLKEHFITRETFQDILLSCHFAVMLISIFGEKYSYLECPLHLTGTDAVEVYFSQNGSFVLNKHTYTIMDMERNLTSMNRLSQIRSCNPNIALRKAHSKQDNIWIKQYKEEERATLKTEIAMKLSDYPSKDELIERWRAGCQMGKELAKTVGLDQNPSACNDDTFFTAPFKFKPYRFGLEEMNSEAQLSANEEDTVDTLIGYDLESGTVTTEDCNDADASRIIDEALMNECQAALQTQLSEELDQETEIGKHQPKIYVPELKAYKYKAQVISELALHGKISADRLTRVREVASGSDKTDETPADKNSIGLFDFIAIKDDKDVEFFIGKVIRIMRRYKTINGRSRKIDYVRPVNVKDAVPDIMFTVNVLQKESLGYKYSDEILETPLNNVLFAVEMYRDQESGHYSLSALDTLSLQSHFQRTHGAHSIDDDGRRVHISVSSRGRIRRNITHTH
eukprot:Seg783.10 transcript_id=Seg783.10/GoldUCD/mRNA.D3Y31 product="hypothetical protein" protein_id=Seg783.10/GoldUCD/D3Y31